MRMPAYTPPPTYDMYGVPIYTDSSHPVRQRHRRESVSCMRLLSRAVICVIVLAMGLIWPLLFMSVCACLSVYYKWDVIKLTTFRLYRPRLARAFWWTLGLTWLFYHEASWHSHMRRCGPVLINVCGASVNTNTNVSRMNMSHVHISNDTHVELNNSMPLATASSVDFSYTSDTTPRQEDFERVVYNLFDATPVVSSVTSLVSIVTNGTCVIATKLTDQIKDIAGVPGRVWESSLERIEQTVYVAKQAAETGFKWLSLVIASVLSVFSAIMALRGIRYNGHTIEVY